MVAKFFAWSQNDGLARYNGQVVNVLEEVSPMGGEDVYYHIRFLDGQHAEVSEAELIFGDNDAHKSEGVSH